MNCPQCSTDMVKAQATNFGEPYDYCRICKKEASEMPKPASEGSISVGDGTILLEARRVYNYTAFAYPGLSKCKRYSASYLDFYGRVAELLLDEAKE